MSVPACPMPIHQTKLIIAQPHMTGWFRPQTPTPVVTRYKIIATNIVTSIRLGMNAHHHHTGVLPSITPATLSVIQPGDR